jgi:hypothetical protein
MENSMTRRERFDSEVNKFGSRQAMFNYYFDYKDGKLYRKNSKFKDKNGKETGHFHRSGENRITIFDFSYAIGRVIYEMHHGDLKKSLVVGHLNKIYIDDRLENLYIQNSSLAGLRQNISKNNISGIKGVHWIEKNKLWRARIVKDYKSISIGCFRSLESAAEAYKEVSKALITKSEIEVKEIIKNHKQKELAA